MTMAQKNRSVSIDRKRVAGGQYHEVAYMKEKYGVSHQKLAGAIRAVGNSRAKLEAYLKNAKD
jgi:predicted 3-demethylubiquinone-9 3-methyltransferase (glyoxalase superfamily)